MPNEINWDRVFFTIELRHKGCGGVFDYLARGGVDIHSSISVDIFCCCNCGKVVTNLEDKKEFERAYRLNQLDEPGKGLR